MNKARTKPCTIWFINQIFNYIYMFSIIPKCLFHPMLFKTTRCISRIKFTEHHRGCGLHPWGLTFRDPEKNGWKLEDYIPFLTMDPFVFQLQGSIRSRWDRRAEGGHTHTLRSCSKRWECTHALPCRMVQASSCETQPAPDRPITVGTSVGETCGRDVARIGYHDYKEKPRHFLHV